jgi:hypothetical protein
MGRDGLYQDCRPKELPLQQAQRDIRLAACLEMHRKMIKKAPLPGRGEGL